MINIRYSSQSILYVAHAQQLQKNNKIYIGHASKKLSTTAVCMIYSDATMIFSRVLWFKNYIFILTLNKKTFLTYSRAKP